MESSARGITLTPGSLAATAAVFLVAAACVRLGFWQLDRLEQRRAGNAGLAERIAAEPITLSGAPLDTSGLVMRRARLSGQWDGELAVALAGRSRGGAPGVHVLTPLRTADGGAVLIDRGFVPSADAATVAGPELRASGEATVEGRLRPLSPVAATEGSMREAGASEGPAGGAATPTGTGAGAATGAGAEAESAVWPALPTWFARSPDGIGNHVPYDLAPLYLVAEERTGEGPYPAPAAPPELDDGPHLGYALQWFSFAAIAVLGWGAMVLKARATRDATPGPAEPRSGR